MTVTLPEGWEAWAERVAAHARATGLPLHTEADVLAAVRAYTEHSERLTMLLMPRTGSPTWPGDMLRDWLADTYEEFRAEAGVA